MECLFHLAGWVHMNILPIIAILCFSFGMPLMVEFKKFRINGQRYYDPAGYWEGSNKYIRLTGIGLIVTGCLAIALFLLVGGDKTPSPKNLYDNNFVTDFGVSAQFDSFASQPFKDQFVFNTNINEIYVHFSAQKSKSSLSNTDWSAMVEWTSDKTTMYPLNYYENSRNFVVLRKPSQGFRPGKNYVKLIIHGKTQADLTFWIVDSNQ